MSKIPAPTPGSIWVHYKGGRYRIVCTALDHETQEESVVYESLSDGRRWIRPLGQFMDQDATSSGPRFKQEEV